MRDRLAVSRTEMICWGTEGSNPSPSSRESGANLIFGDESHQMTVGNFANGEYFADGMVEQIITALSYDARRRAHLSRRALRAASARP
jgi:hypothetical protein